MDYAKLTQDEDGIDQSIDRPLYPYEKAVDLQRSKKSWFDICWKSSVLVLQGLILVLLILDRVSLEKIGRDCPSSRTTNSIESGERVLLETYGFDNRYMTLDPTYDYLWEDDLATDVGDVMVPNTQGTQQNYGVIAMFHQLHCLAHMRLALQNAKAGEDIGSNPNDNAHWPHCLHYLRMSILCQADDVIERPEASNGTMRDDESSMVDGRDDVRHCRSARPLYEMRSSYGQPQYHELNMSQSLTA